MTNHLAIPLPITLAGREVYERCRGCGGGPDYRVREGKICRRCEMACQDRHWLHWLESQQTCTEVSCENQD